ncbi:hypothetical protein VTJ04DRAFT_9521 [Mycothermus thermophilus]|uniref:uncharacterized protein n=1 Tax=Humicola insolens TaxID=85995 RepID=UPI003742DF47
MVIRGPHALVLDRHGGGLTGMGIRARCIMVLVWDGIQQKKRGRLSMRRFLGLELWLGSFQAFGIELAAEIESTGQASRPPKRGHELNNEDVRLEIPPQLYRVHVLLSSGQRLDREDRPSALFSERPRNTLFMCSLQRWVKLQVSHHDLPHTNTSYPNCSTLGMRL